MTITQAVEKVVAHFQQSGQAQDAEPNFNIFSLLGVGTDEVSHSAFLAWLLDAQAGHGEGDRFLQVFLGACQPPIDIQLPDTCSVATEFSGVDSRIDIMVYQAGAFLLFIENKTVSPAGLNQHDREIADMRRVGATLGVPEGSQYAIFLTPEGRAASGDAAGLWHRVAYRDLGRALEDMLPYIDRGKLRAVLKDWLDAITAFTYTWRGSVVGFSDESVYVGANWESVLAVVRAREQLDKELLEILRSVHADLRDLDWWRRGWQFLVVGSEICIYNENWVDEKGHRILWTGVYDFRGDRVFGLSPPPQFYVRVRPDCEDLEKALMEKCRTAGHPITATHRYMINRDLQKCVTERQGIEAYPQAVRRQIVELLDEYANLLTQFEETILAYVREMRSAR